MPLPQVRLVLSFARREREVSQHIILMAGEGEFRVSAVAPGVNGVREDFGVGGERERERGLYGVSSD